MIDITDAETLLNIIDDRALKNTPRNIVYRTPMVVTSVAVDYSKANVKVPGDKFEYILLNKTGEILFSGDNVVIESIGTNLNNGIIAYKLGTNTINLQNVVNAKTRVYFQDDAPTGGEYTIGDTWFDTNDGNKIYKWDGTDWVAVFLGLPALSSVVTDAITGAQTTADGKNTVYYQNSAPTGGTYKIGDTWFDMDDGSKIYRWSGSAWVAVFLGLPALSSVVTDAITGAQTTADGKNTVYYQNSAPTGGTYKIGDTWFDMDGDNAIYRWSGTAWVAAQLGANAIANLSIVNAHIVDATIASAKIAALDAGKITTGYLGAERLAAGTITADNISIIADAAITSAKIGALDAGKITTGYLGAARLAAGTITADSAILADLCVTSAKISSIDAAKITAGKIQSADTKTYFDLTNNEIKQTATVGGKTIVITINPTVGLTITADAAPVFGVNTDGSVFANRLSNDINGGNYMTYGYTGAVGETPGINCIAPTHGRYFGVNYSATGGAGIFDKNFKIRQLFEPDGSLRFYDLSVNTILNIDVSNNLSQLHIPSATNNAIGVDATGAYKITGGTKTYLYSVNQQTHRTDAKVDYVAADVDTAAEIATRLNDTNAIMNSIILRLENLGLFATS